MIYKICVYIYIFMLCKKRQLFFSFELYLFLSLCIFKYILSLLCVFWFDIIILSKVNTNQFYKLEILQFKANNYIQNEFKTSLQLMVYTIVIFSMVKFYSCLQQVYTLDTCRLQIIRFIILKLSSRVLYVVMPQQKNL